MKIWICHQYALAPHHAGVTRHFMLAHELVRRGHEATIIAAATSHKNPNACALRPDENFRFENHDGVRFLWLRTPSPSHGKAARVWNMLMFAKQLLTSPAMRDMETPDIIIGNTPDPFTALAALLLSHFRKKPYVLHIGDLWPLSLVDIGGISPWHPFIMLLAAIEKVLYRFSNFIITPLPGACPYILSKGGKTGRVAQVPIVVDTAHAPSVSIQPQNEAFTFIFAGAHGPGNGVETLVRACAAFEKNYPGRPFRLRMIGAGELKARLQNLAMELKLGNISLEPAVSKREIYKLLAEADAFILNVANLRVFRESGISPNKLFDFMLVGRPIVIGCSASNNPVAEAGAGISAAADSPDDMAQAMARMMDLSLQERQNMADRGRVYIEKHNRLPLVIDGLEKILNDLRA